MSIRKGDGKVTKEDIGKYALPASMRMYMNCDRPYLITNVVRSRVYLSRDRSRKQDWVDGKPDPQDIEHSHVQVKSINYIADTEDEAKKAYLLSEAQFRESVDTIKAIEERTHASILAVTK